MQCCSGCGRQHDIDIYLNGKHVKDAIYANDETGVVWAYYRDVAGKLVPECDGEPGAMFHSGAQIIRLTGRVEIRIRLSESEDEAAVRQLIDETSGPIKVFQWVE